MISPRYWRDSLMRRIKMVFFAHCGSVRKRKYAYPSLLNKLLCNEWTEKWHPQIILSNLISLIRFYWFIRPKEGYVEPFWDQTVMTNSHKNAPSHCMYIFSFSGYLGLQCNFLPQHDFNMYTIQPWVRNSDQKSLFLLHLFQINKHFQRWIHAQLHYLQSYMHWTKFLHVQ